MQYITGALDPENKGDVVVESSVQVVFTDGTEEWDSLHEFARADEDLSPRNVVQVRYTAKRQHPSSLAVGVFATHASGVTAVIEGERRVLVDAVQAEAERWLERGRVPERLPDRRQPHWSEVSVGVLAVAPLAGSVTLMVLVPQWNWLLFCSAFLLTVFFGFVLFDSAEPIYPPAPALEWTTTEATARRRRQEPNGPILRAAEWVKAHPLISIALTIALNLAANGLYDFLT